MAGVKARFLGSWRITTMEQWDREYMDTVAPASILFAASGSGEVQFGTVQGSPDCRFAERDRLWRGGSRSFICHDGANSGLIPDRHDRRPRDAEGRAGHP